MEDVKWLFRKCGFPILIFLFVVIVGTVCWGKLKTEKPHNVAEEVWEPPVEIENSKEVSVEETDTESSMESVYWFVPQSENQIVVQPFEDGTFRYLSNSIEQKELDLPPIARTYP